MKKKLLALLLITALLCTLFPQISMFASAEDAAYNSCGENITWEFIFWESLFNKILLTGTGDMYDYDFYADNAAPWEGFDFEELVITEGITSVGNFAFFDEYALQKVQLPSTLTRIGEYGFYCCRNLHNISLPDGLRYIEDEAFRSCDGLESIMFPQGLLEIGEYAFSDCNALKNVTLPGSLLEIGEGAFSECNALKNVTLPGSLLEISEYSFWGCFNLESVELQEGIEKIGASAFCNDFLLTDAALPESLCEIGEDAFGSCALKEVTVPANTSKIGDGAFSSDTLEKITILNPLCKIESTLSGARTLGNPKVTTIYGYSNSTAYQFAVRYGFSFVSIGDPGDIEIPDDLKQISKIEIPDFSIMEGTSGNWEVWYGYPDEDTDALRWNNQVDLSGRAIITYADGTTKVWNEDEDSEQYFYIEYAEGTPEEWKAGDTIKATAYFVDGSYFTEFSDDFEVHIEPSPIDRVEIGEAVCWENGDESYDCYNEPEWGWTYNEQTGAYDIPIGEIYTRYYCIPSYVTVYFKDGTELTWSKETDMTEYVYDRFSSFYYLGDKIGEKLGLSEQESYQCFATYMPQHPDKEWGIGEHEAYIGIFGQVYPFAVQIIENPVESITAENVTIEEHTNGFEWEAYELDGVMCEAGWYYDLESVVEITVNFKDGSSVTGRWDELFTNEKLAPRAPTIISDQRATAKWTCGVHSADVEYCGKQTSVLITILPADDPTDQYIDVPSSDNWAYGGIDFCIKCGIMGSTKTNALTFEPNTACTRSMIVSILYRLSGSPAVTYEAKFPDIKAGQWYSDAVIWAYQNGIVSGYGDGKFGPNDKITREQMAVILKGYADFKGIDTSKMADLSDFPDCGKVTWSKAAVRWAVAEGLISGKSNNGKTILDPQGNATRAEVASILMRFIENILEA